MAATKLVLPLTRTVSFTVSVTPWANLYLDGKLVGTTPFDSAIRYRAGPAVVRLENPYYPPLTESVYLRENGHYTFNLNELFGAVEVLAVPWAVVYIDGQFVDTTPIASPIALIKGRHNIKLINPNLGTRELDFMIAAAEKKRIYVDFTKE